MIDEPPPAPEGDADYFDGSPKNNEVIGVGPVRSFSSSIIQRHAADLITLDDVDEDAIYEERRRSALLALHHGVGHHHRAHHSHNILTRVQGGRSPGESEVAAGLHRVLASHATNHHLTAVHEARRENSSFAHVSGCSAAPASTIGGDSFTDEGTVLNSSATAAGGTDVCHGLGPNVLKKISDAYEVVCRDLRPGGSVIADLCGKMRGVESVGNSDLRRPHSTVEETPPLFVPVAKISSTSAPRKENRIADSAVIIRDQLRAHSAEALVQHCTELHLILLRLLEFSKMPHYTALVAMQSMASLSPQQVAPFQTTHTMEKVVDDDGMKSINGYMLLEELGRGSCAKVKLAYDTNHARMVAIKVVRRVDMTTKVGGQTQAQAQYQSLQREIAVMKKLRHKNIVSLYEVIDDPDAEKLYIVMQYVDNGPITVMRGDRCTPVEPSLLLRYARHIFAGLMYLHHHKVVHRDIKLENILVSKDRVAFLADFGVSDAFGLATSRRTKTHFDDQSRRKKTIEGHKGTILYMAPELLADGHAENGMSVDVWACGVTLFAALTGSLPFKSVEEILSARAHLHIPHEFGKDWENLLRRLLSISPQDRPTAVAAHAEVQRMLSKEAAKQSVQPKGGASLEIAHDDLDSAFTPVYTTGGRINSMLQEGRFCRAQLMGDDCSVLRSGHEGNSTDNDDAGSCGSLGDEDALGLHCDAFKTPTGSLQEGSKMLQPQPPSCDHCLSDTASPENSESTFRLRGFARKSTSLDKVEDLRELSQTAPQLPAPIADHSSSHRSSVRSKVSSIIAARDTSD